MGVSTLPDYACTEGNMKLIAANADLLIMIIYVQNSLIGETAMNSETTKKHKSMVNRATQDTF